MTALTRETLFNLRTQYLSLHEIVTSAQGKISEARKSFLEEMLQDEKAKKEAKEIYDDMSHTFYKKKEGMSPRGFYVLVNMLETLTGVNASKCAEILNEEFKAHQASTGVDVSGDSSETLTPEDAKTKAKEIRENFNSLKDALVKFAGLDSNEKVEGNPEENLWDLPNLGGGGRPAGKSKTANISYHFVVNGKKISETNLGSVLSLYKAGTGIRDLNKLLGHDWTERNWSHKFSDNLTIEFIREEVSSVSE